MRLHSIHTALSYPTRGHQDLELKDTNKPNPKLGTGVGRSIGRKGKRGKVKGGKIRMNRMWTPTLINIEYLLYTSGGCFHAFSLGFASMCHALV